MWEPGLQKTKTILNTNSLIFFLPGKIKIYFPVYIVVLFIIRVVVEVLGFMNILDYVNYIKCKMCQKKQTHRCSLAPAVLSNSLHCWPYWTDLCKNITLLTLLTLQKQIIHGFIKLKYEMKINAMPLYFTYIKCKKNNFYN